MDMRNPVMTETPRTDTEIHPPAQFTIRVLDYDNPIATPEQRAAGNTVIGHSPHNGLTPWRRHVSQDLWSRRALPFVIHSVLHVFLLCFGVFGQQLIAKWIGQSGLHFMKNLYFCLPCIVLFTMWSQVMGQFIYFQGPFLTLAALTSGLVFTFWLACLVSAVMTVSALAGFYYTVKPRIKPSITINLNDGDPFITNFFESWNEGLGRLYLLSLGFLSIIPSQLLMLASAVIESQSWEVVCTLLFAAANAISPTYVGYSITFAIEKDDKMENRSHLLYGIMMLFLQLSFAMFVFRLTPCCGSFRGPLSVVMGEAVQVPAQPEAIGVPVDNPLMTPARLSTTESASTPPRHSAVSASAMLDQGTIPSDATTSSSVARQ